MERSKMRNKKSFLPGFFTGLNAFCGFLSILYATDNHPLIAAWLIMLAAVFDGMDGKVARFTHSYSNFGVEFDSLADIISFGVAPGILLYRAYFYTFGHWGVIVSFLPTLFGGIRLARFNIRVSSFDKECYLGLPIPTMAITLSSFLVFNHSLGNGLKLSGFLTPLTLFLCILMISPIEYETLPKFSLRNTKKNLIKLLIFLVCSGIIIIFPEEAIFPIAIGFVFFGILRWFINLIKSGEIADIPVSDEALR